MDKKIKISVIIPCYRSEKYLEETVEEILQSFQKHGEFVPELILVDDHSPDGTAAVVEKLGDRPGITAVCLTENLGQARAKLQGVSCASGDAAVFMDDDGQHDPEGIFLLLDKLDLRSFSSGRNGLHLVYAQFPKKKESLQRRAASFLTNLVLCVTTGKPGKLVITSFFAVDREALDALREYRSEKPFTGAYVWHCFGKKSVAGIRIPHRNREYGSSTYSLKKLIRTFWNLNTSMLEIRRYPRRY